MPFITTNGEKTIDALLDRAYDRLTDRQRVTARAALLRANPRLTKIERLPPGTLINVPSRAFPRTKVSRKANDPDGEVLNDINRALTSFAKEYRIGHETLMEELKESLSIARSKIVIKAVGQTEDLKDLHGKTVGRLDEERSKQEAQKAGFDKIVDMAREDIKKRL